MNIFKKSRFLLWSEAKISNVRKKAITTEVCPMCLLISRRIHMLLFTEEKTPNPKAIKTKQPSFGLGKNHNTTNLIP